MSTDEWNINDEPFLLYKIDNYNGDYASVEDHR